MRPVRPESYSRLSSHEGTVTSETTITFKVAVKRVIIANDHASNTLTFKFNSAETVATIKAGESVSIPFNGTSIIINSTSAPYRIWGIG